MLLIGLGLEGRDRIGQGFIVLGFFEGHLGLRQRFRERRNDRSERGHLRGGESYIEGQYRQWMTGAGFRDITRSRLAGGSTLFRGRVAG